MCFLLKFIPNLETNFIHPILQGNLSTKKLRGYIDADSNRKSKSNMQASVERWGRVRLNFRLWGWVGVIFSFFFFLSRLVLFFFFFLYKKKEKKEKLVVLGHIDSKWAMVLPTITELKDDQPRKKVFHGTNKSVPLFVD